MKSEKSMRRLSRVEHNIWRHFGSSYTFHTHTHALPDSKTHVKYTHTRQHMLHIHKQDMSYMRASV